MKDALLIIFGLTFLYSMFRSFYLGGNVLNRLNFVYPDGYKDLTWLYGTKLNFLSFIKKVNKKEITDPELCNISKKLQLYIIVSFLSWICFMFLMFI